MTGSAGGRRKVHSMADDTTDSEPGSQPAKLSLGQQAECSGSSLDAQPGSSSIAAPPLARASASRVARGSLVASLLLLLAVLIFSATLDPVVQAFGLAHARLDTVEGGRVLVMDHLPSADAPAVQTLFDGEIWGRHGFKAQQILLPFVVLLASLAALSYALFHLVCQPGSRFFHLSRGWAPPPLGLWGALFLGGCFAAWAVEQPTLHPTLALIPFVIAMLVCAVMALAPHPSALWAQRAFTTLTGTRWFWLGFLTLSPVGLFRHASPVDGVVTPQLSLSALLACAGALAALSWATRRPGASSYERFKGDTAELQRGVESLTLLAIQELWLILPAVLMAATVSSLRVEFLAPYLAASVACALMMRWSVRAASRPSSSLETARRWAFRALTLALLAGWPFSVQLTQSYPELPLSPATWLVALALCMVAGRPSTFQSKATALAQPAPPWRPSLAGGLLGLATAGALTLALGGGLPSSTDDFAVTAAQAKLDQSFAHQARLLRINGRALLIGCDLDVARLSAAAEIVSGYLPETETSVVSVRTRRWERAARISLALTVALFLVCPTYLLTFATPGRASRPYLAFCALMAGGNGAFAVGGALGWFWLYPLPHLAAFGLSTALGWLGLGYARAWIDGRVALQEGASPGLLPARNTTA